MPKTLSSAAVEAYRRDGYCFPVPAPFRRAAHANTVERQVKALYSGTDKQAFRA